MIRHAFPNPRREALEDIVERALAALDELDGPTEDFEPDPDGEPMPDEASLQPLTLSPDRRGAVRIVPIRMAA